MAIGAIRDPVSTSGSLNMKQGLKPCRAARAPLTEVKPVRGEYRDAMKRVARIWRGRSDGLLLHLGVEPASIVHLDEDSHHASNRLCISFRFYRDWTFASAKKSFYVFGSIIWANSRWLYMRYQALLLPVPRKHLCARYAGRSQRNNRATVIGPRRRLDRRNPRIDPR